MRQEINNLAENKLIDFKISASPLSESNGRVPLTYFKVKIITSFIFLNGVGCQPLSRPLADIADHHLMNVYVRICGLVL